MKRYIKPVAECYNVNFDSVMQTPSSVGISNTAADASYTGGGDAKRGRTLGFGDFDDEEE